jgi:chromosome segregation ATPase
MSKTSAGKQNKCLTLDGEIRQLKKKLEVSKVERDSADNQIKQVRSQLESVQKNDPLEKKLQLQITQLNQGKTAVEVKMVEMESRLSANLLKQNDLRNEVKTLQGMLAGQAAGRNASDREIIQLKNKLELHQHHQIVVLKND